MAFIEPWQDGQGHGDRRTSQDGDPRQSAKHIDSISPARPWPLSGVSRRDALRALLALARPLVRCEETLDSQSCDLGLSAFSEELRDIESTLRRLLASDDRDASDIPGYVSLADRHTVLVEALCSIRAQGRHGLLAKARAVAIRDARAGYDGAISIAVSLAADVVAVLGSGDASEHESTLACRIVRPER